MSNAYVFNDKEDNGPDLIAIRETNGSVSIHTLCEEPETKRIITLSKRDLEELLELAKEE